MNLTNNDVSQTKSRHELRAQLPSSRVHNSWFYRQSHCTRLCNARHVQEMTVPMHLVHMDIGNGHSEVLLCATYASRAIACGT